MESLWPASPLILVTGRYQRVLHRRQAIGFGPPYVGERKPFEGQEGHRVRAEEDQRQDAQSESRNPDP